MAQSSRRTIRWLYVLLGLLAVAAGLVVGFLDPTYLIGGAIAEAKVVKLEKPASEEVPFDPNDPTPRVSGFRITYEYEDATGKKQKGHHTSPSQTYAEGDTLQVQYSLDAPAVSDIVPPKSQSRWLGMAGLLVLALVLLAAGVWGVFRRRPAFSPPFSSEEIAPDPGAITLPDTPGPETHHADSPAAPGLPAETPPDTIKPGPASEV